MYVLIEVDSSLTKSVALFSLLLILLLNIFGVKKVEKTQLLIVSISVVSLFCVVFFGFGSFDSALTEPVFAKESSGFISAVAFLYISYAGVTKVAAVAGEIKNPEKNLPKSMLLSLLLVTIIYVLVAIILVGNVEASLLVNDIKPIYTLSQALGGDTFGYIAGVIGVLTLFSMANSGMLASSRFPFAMARDKMLPEFLGSVSGRFMTPVYSIIVTALIIGLAILYLDIEKIAKLASAFKVLMFISVNLAVIVLRETNAQWYNPSYRSPFYPYVQIFGVLSGIVLLAYLGLMPLLSVLGAFVFGFITFFFYGRKTNRKGVFSSYGVFSFLFRSGQESAEDLRADLNQNEEEVVNTSAEIVVPLLGDEMSPETLVEIASSIKSNVKLNAINLIEAPNQTFLEAINTHSPKAESIKRRILNIKSLNKTELTYETISTHNVSNSIENITGQRKCKWLVMGWEGRSRSGILIGNPIGWLLRNVNSSFALYKDNGVRSFEKVVLALRPGRKNKAFIEVAENICGFYGAKLTLLNIIPFDTPSEIKKTIVSSSSMLISKTSCESEFVIVDSDNPLETISEQSANFDLLILGTPEKDNWLNVLFSGGRDKFVHNSGCSVLRLTIK